MAKATAILFINPRTSSSLVGRERPPFELATAELRKLGITLRQLPGEFSVNFRDGDDATARTAEIGLYSNCSRRCSWLRPSGVESRCSSISP
jgi:hypothetical protein